MLRNLKDMVEKMWIRFNRLSDLNKLVVLALVALTLFLLFKYYKKNIENMEGEGGVLRFFYADWCPHCKSTKPVWEQLKERYSGSVTLKKVDCTSSTKEAEKFDVEGFPTFILTKNGKNTEYEGERTVDGFMDFLNSKN